VRECEADLEPAIEVFFAPQLRQTKSKSSWALLLAVLVLASSGCDSDLGDADDTTSSTQTPTTAANEAPTATTIDGLIALPVRDGPREETSHSVPHIQINAVPIPEVDAELRRRAFSLPGVETGQSRLSLPGATGLWLADDIELARPEVLQSGREFAHIHPDGSLHVWLPVDRAVEVDETKWGELHPWVERNDFWDGVVMVYTPETLDEVNVAIRLLVDAYNYVTGLKLDPEAF
jgi:hypothetical protein